MSRPKCEGGISGLRCYAWPLWKLRDEGDTLERNWLFACGRHLNQIAREQAVHAGMKLDLIRIHSDE
jgi:hypothetical protein